MSLFDFIPDHQEKKPGLLIIDYSQIALSTVFAAFRPNELYTEQLLKTTILNTIRANIKRFKDKHPEIVIAVDARDYWRKEVASYYKGHRAKGRDASPWDFVPIYSAMNSLEADLTNHFPYKVMNVHRCEADDIAGVLVKYYHAVYENIMLVSSDGDWTQLQKYPNVKQYSSIQGKFVKPKQGTAKATLLYKIIKGDKKDAVANIRSQRDSVITGVRQTSIAEKEFEKWSKLDPREFCTEEMFARFKENESLLDLSMVPDQYEQAILGKFQEPGITSRAKIYPYLLKNGFSQMLDKITDF